MKHLIPEPQDVTRIHQAATEVEALALEHTLGSAGLPVWLRSRQVPGFGEAIATAWGVWGDVLVRREDADQARALVTAYLNQVEHAAGTRLFFGIIPPLVTLFDASGRIDYDGMARHVDRLLEAGVHGLFALGSTGEVMHLTPDERREIAAFVVRRAEGRVPVLIGCGGTGTDEVIGYVRHAREIGAAGAVVIVPYYWTLSDAAVEAHFAAVASATDLPIILYNFPGVSGRNLAPLLVARLAQAHPAIAGIKETLDSVGHIQQVLAHARPHRPDFSVLCGFEFHLLNTLLLGGDGAIPGMANVAPATSVAVYEAFRRGEVEAAAEMMRRRLDFPALYELGAPLFVVVKEAMFLAGHIAHATVRLPALPLTDGARARLHSLLADLGLL